MVTFFFMFERTLKLGTNLSLAFLSFAEIGLTGA